jgi:ABC-type Mn2+/Zn2+ transport system permease subunit
MSTAAIDTRGRPAARRIVWTPAIELAGYLAVCTVAAAVLLERATAPEAGAPRALAAPLWTMLVGAACNASCAIVGCYLVLRRLSLLGDAITHAVLPGIALAYLFSHSVSGWPIFVGALVFGILASVLTQAISNLGRVSEDTSLGIVFTSLFALGVILISRFAHADLDPGCVLYGLIEVVSLDMTPVLGVEVSRPLLTLVPMLVLTIVFVAALWKELKIVAFDPALAAAMGIPVAVVHYALMMLVAGVAVASFESVGSILVVAMLIVPPAAAALVTDRLMWMIAWAVAIGAASAVFGYLLADALNTSVAGAMAVVAGGQFALAVLLAPRSGLVSRWLRNTSLSIRIAAEDVLAGLYRVEEGTGVRRAEAKGEESVARGRFVEPASPRAHGGGGPWAAIGELLAGGTVVDRLGRWRLFRAGWVRRGDAGELRLTDAGRAAARSLIRAHRLWETYLDTHFDLPRDHLHDAAERMEHFLGAELQEELAAELADRAVDPHGKEIPPPAG